MKKKRWYCGVNDTKDFFLGGGGEVGPKSPYYEEKEF
jgi:hypothetical protein